MSIPARGRRTAALAARVPSDQRCSDLLPVNGGRRVCRPARGPGGVSGSASIPSPSSPVLARPSTRTYTPGPPAAAPPAAAALTSSSFLLLARDTFCICKASQDQPRTLLPSGRCRVVAVAPGTCVRTRVVGAFASSRRPDACPPHFFARGDGGAHDFLKSPFFFLVSISCFAKVGKADSGVRTWVFILPSPLMSSGVWCNLLAP